MTKSSAKEKRYREAVAKARKIYAQIKKDQMAIAKLAYENCDIITGGHVTGTVFSLSMFAADLNINRKTLSDWVHNYEIQLIAKNQLRGKIDAKKLENQQELNKIRKILRGKKGGLRENIVPEKILDAYNENRVISDDERKFSALTRHTMNLEYAVCHGGVDLEYVNQEDIAKVRGYVREILAKLDEYAEEYVLPDVTLRKRLDMKSRKEREGNLLQLRRGA